MNIPLYKIGIKTGLLAGVIAGIATAAGYVGISLFFIYVLQTPIEKSTLVPHAGSALSVSADQLGMVSLAASSAVAGVILGAILGVAFSLIHTKYLKRRSLRLKGLVLGTALWPASLALAISNSNIFEPGFLVAKVALEFATDLLAGYLVGYFYLRFALAKPLPDELL